MFLFVVFRIGSQLFWGMGGSIALQNNLLHIYIIASQIKRNQCFTLKMSTMKNLEVIQQWNVCRKTVINVIKSK